MTVCPRWKSRRRAVADLKAQGALLKEERYTHEVGHCDRCDTMIEPLISEQWWLRMEVMRDKALQASAAQKVRWHPDRYERTYLDWLRGLRDWNIGRQLWLGHRVPVYYLRQRAPAGRRRPPSRMHRMREHDADPASRRARHVVLIRAVAIRHARLAR